MKNQEIIDRKEGVGVRMVWTREKPSVPGWYWWRRGGETMVVKVVKPGRELLILCVGTSQMVPVEIAHASCEWCGPIPEPKC